MKNCNCNMLTVKDLLNKYKSINRFVLYVNGNDNQICVERGDMLKESDDFVTFINDCYKIDIMNLLVKEHIYSPANFELRAIVLEPVCKIDKEEIINNENKKFEDEIKTLENPLLTMLWKAYNNR